MRDLDLRDVRVFVRVVELRSFAATARSLHIAKSSVSRSVARLEEHLGTVLLRRTPRALTLTDAGEQYYARISEALHTILEASSEAKTAEHPRGVVRISAPPAFGTEALPVLVTQFVETYPEVQVEVHLSTSLGGLVEDGFDLAIRGGPQPDSSLRMTKLFDSSFRLFASQDYLQRSGVPSHPNDLRAHTCILFLGNGPRSRWPLLGPEGLCEVEVQGAVASNGLAFIRRAAIAGAGIALLPEVPGEHAVRRGALTRVLPTYSVETSPLFLVSSASLHVPPRVQLLRTFLLQAFQIIDPTQPPQNFSD